MARARTTFDFSDGHMSASIGRLQIRNRAKIKQKFEMYGDYGVGWAKTHAPWTDRTGAARSGLHHGPVQVEGGRLSRNRQYSITFAHTVHYGIYLELANSGRYAIIAPTYRHVGELMMRDMQGLM